MPIQSWNSIDLAILLTQAALILFYLVTQRKTIGLAPALVGSLSAWLVATPIGLFPVAILPEYASDVTRNAFWHTPVAAGLSFNDWIIVSVLVLMVFEFILRRVPVRRWFATSLATTCGVFLLGFVAAIQAPMGVDAHNFLIAARVMLLLLLGAAGGYRAGVSGSSDWFKRYMWLLMQVSLLSLVSMLLLSADYRPSRYWTHALLQSQGTQLVALMFLLLAASKQLTTTKRQVAFLFGLLPVLAAYKGSIAMAGAALPLVLLAFFWRMRNVSAGVKQVLINILLVLETILPVVLVVVFTSTITAIDAIGTRYYQLVNAWDTLRMVGWGGVLFGIGWQQWYKVLTPFPFLDLGAWTPAQLVNPGWKFSIQTSPAALVTSVGLVGGILWVWVTAMASRRAYATLCKRLHPLISLALVAWLILDVLSFPEVLPEEIFMAAMILFGLGASAETELL